MASDLISRKALLEAMDEVERKLEMCMCIPSWATALKCIRDFPTVDAVEVVHGEWLSAYEYALKIGVTDEERLEEAKKDKWWKFCNNCEQQVRGVRNYCPNCGADMRVGRWKGEGMGDFSCSLCGEVVSGNHREECPNCHAKMDGGEKE